jgi:hypothetical protein
MALKQISGNVDYIKWSEVEEGVTIKGYYKESKPSAKYPDNLNHYIETAEGKVYGLNGSANLDRALDQIKQGWWIEITYDGQTTLENGRFAGRPCHQFTLRYDDERVHPLFGGSSAANQNVEYKNGAKEGAAAEASEKPAEKTAEKKAETPALVKPGTDSQSAASKPAAAKRSVF